MVKAWPGVPAVSSAPRLTFASSPCTSVYLVPEIVKFLKLAKLLVVLSVPLVGVMTSPAVPNVWVQPLSPASETKYFWPPVSGPSPVNDQAPVLAVPLVGVMTSPAVPNVWVQPLSPASETKYFWPPVSGPSPVNDQAPVL